MEEFERICNLGVDSDKKTYRKFKRILFRNDPFNNIFAKDNENIYLLDNSNCIRIHLKVVPILAIINKEFADTYLIMTSVGKNNNILKTNLAKYYFAQAYDLLDDINKSLSNNKYTTWGTESYTDNDYYKYMKLNKNENINGIIINFDTINTMIQTTMHFIIGKLKTKGYIKLVIGEYIKYFLILDYDIIKEGKYKLNDKNEIITL